MEYSDILNIPPYSMKKEEKESTILSNIKILLQALKC